MFNNKGYVASERSVRSQEAIERHEVPLSHITSDLIEDCLKSDAFIDYFSEGDLEYLYSLKAGIWKYTARYLLGATSWHHTSKFFNQTNHYDLFEVAEKLLERKDDVIQLYKDHLNEKEERKRTYKFGVIVVAVWGGTKRYPKIIDYDEIPGVVVNGWLHSKETNLGKIKRNLLDANKVVSRRIFDSVDELIKEFPHYQNRKELLLSLVNEVVKK